MSLGRQDPLSEAKRALLARWSLGTISRVHATPAPEQAGPQALEVSACQQRQLFLEALAPATAVHHLVAAWRIRGALDLEALRVAVRTLLERHDALRLRFAGTGAHMEAVVEARVALPFELLAGGASCEHDPEAERSALEREVQRPFDLRLAPLLRVRVRSTSAREHVLLVVVHHAVADGMSLAVVVRELGIAYAAAVAGRVPDLGPPPLRWAEVVRAEQEMLSAGALEEDLRYWVGRLGGELPLLDLPTDAPRPPRRSLRGGTQHASIPASQVATVRELARRHDATPFMVLLSAYVALLHRLTGQAEVVVGTPVARRGLPGTESLVGALINPVALRVDTSGDPTFLELLGRVRTTALEAYGHQAVPFQRVVSALRTPRDPSRTPVFQAVFNLHGAAPEALALGDAVVEPLVLERGATDVDLTVVAVPAGGGLDLAFEHALDCHDGSTVRVWAQAFCTLLEDALGDPGANLSSLALATREERRAELAWGSARTLDLPEPVEVDERVRRHAARAPGDVAVVDDEGALTYAELEQQVAFLADALVAHGAGAGTRVAVRLERSTSLVVALLAVLRSGAAYVPLDPGLPAARSERMQVDARVGWVVEPAFGGASRRGTQIRARGLSVPEAPRREAGPHDAAYVIYTSGSTGAPKGVEVPRRALSNVLASMQSIVRAGRSDVCLATSSVAFDVAALELFLPLWVGGRVVLASAHLASDGARLEALVRTHGITLLQATPTVWRLRLRTGFTSAPGTTALCGGEALTLDLARALAPRVSRLLNVYGPTETTIWSAYEEVPATVSRITLGRALANTSLYVLDRRLAPVPVGVVGELCIGGQGVASGYWGDEGRTAERFVDDPFLPAGAGRIFRTGDRARRRSDGSLEVLGREDDQVKVHGVRVELGEVEAALRACDDVRDATVVARTGPAGDRTLAAYVVPRDDHPPRTRDIRAFLAQRLPACMIPPLFVPVAELPLTPTGKVDRAALAAIPLPAAEPDPGGAPRTSLERVLASLFAQILGVPEVDVRQGFFDLGGGSIQLLELVAAARSQGIELTPELCFEHPSVAALAQGVETLARGAVHAAHESTGEAPDGTR